MKAKVTVTTLSPLTGERLDHQSKVIAEQELSDFVDNVVRVTCLEYYATTPADDRAIVDIRIEWL